MRRELIAGLLALSPLAAFAQPAVLLEACNAIQDSAKRLECLKAAAGPAATQPAAHEAVVRAFVGLDGALSSGMTIASYQAAVQDLARELALFKRDAPPAAAPAIERLGKSLDVYGDAATFWAEAIRFYSRRGNDLSYGGGLPVGMVGLGWMLTKYGMIPKAHADMLGINVGIPVDAGRRYMWYRAKELADEGIALLKQPPAPTASATEAKQQ